MTMNPTPRKVDDESQKAIDEWLAKGNKVTQLPAYKRSEEISYAKSFYGRKPKKGDNEES